MCDHKKFEDSTELLYQNELNIICPYCDYIDTDSWESGIDNCGVHECPACGKEMWVDVEHSIDYTTYRKKD